MSDRALLVLIGAPGAGKTRTGKRLSKLLGAPLIDTDSTVVSGHGPIAKIFEEHGEPHFRALERAAVAAALREPAIVTLGGGAVLDAETQADLEGLPVVQLTVRPDAVEKRIANGKRPLVSSGIDAWAALVASRQPIYDRLSQLTIDTSDVPLDSVAVRIADWLETRRHD
ncbi:shikimate kinase [Salinibacterium soli]|uniref:Shikimate kinase n=1 Tax=Antiquaquibacter soli TaxID=3064523 RepID=A0ABT9BLY4_9MICO|nr:shikimate kinase [Protaetiibacter sp. WY-16]MDO7882031.1 shikimate kinase [Protaetiibacter sp. WY-16]